MDVSTVAQEVLGLIRAEGLALSENLTDLEQVVRQTVLRIGARAVELHLGDKRLGYEGASRACDNPECRHDQKFVGHRPRTLATLLGQVTRDLGKVNASGLNSDGRTQYDAARRFVQQSEDALKARNLLYAGKLADKAAAMAAVLVR